MKRSSVFAIAVLALAAPLAGIAQSARLHYPPAPRDRIVDTYFGTRVPDPYRWLEAIDSPQTRTWARAERRLTARYLAGIPQRAAIAAALRRTADYEKIGLPMRVGHRYFFFENSGLQNQSVLYARMGVRGAPRVLVDPNRLSADGTVALGPIAVSDDARYLAYATQRSGSDWETWHVRNIATGTDLPDTLRWSKFSGASWRKDDSGFYYERYAAPKPGQTYAGALYDQRVYFHRLGTPQSADRLVYGDPAHGDAFYDAVVTTDGRYVVLTQSSGRTDNTRVRYEDLAAVHPAFKPLFVRNDARWSFIANDGSRFFFETDKNAPNHAVVAVDVRHPESPSTIVPQASSAIESVGAVGHRLFVSYLQDAHSRVAEFDERGRHLRDVALPGVGTASGFEGRPDDRFAYYAFSSYTTPPVVFSYDVRSGVSHVYRRASVRFDPSRYVTDEVFYRSKDGTRVPMMIAHRKDLVLDGRNPTILYGYGGFDIPITPSFSPYVATWLEMGGIYAVANIRGGSEYGEAWHRAGMRAHKQRVFDDFIAAAQYLIAKRYTSTPKLAIKGESNGGLLVGAVETQRPDLFGAVLAGVGVMDMLRFQDFTIGNAWISEYGCSTCSKAQFETLLRYSPYANIRKGTRYPPTLVSTADHDDRVYPAHSFKFAARMQWAQGGDAPILLRIDSKSGHGGGKPVAKVIEDYADSYAFLVRALHVVLPPDFQR